MARLAEPGLAFSMPTAVGHLVGLVTYSEPELGSLCWIATQTFDHAPTGDDVRTIDSWRWPVWFPARSAIRRRIATEIAVVDIPAELSAFPTMRSGDRHIGWIAFNRVDGSDRSLGQTTDWELPIDKAVNDVRLREMVETNWHQRTQF